MLHDCSCNEGIVRNWCTIFFPFIIVFKAKLAPAVDFFQDLDLDLYFLITMPSNHVDLSAAIGRVGDLHLFLITNCLQLFLLVFFSLVALIAFLTVLVFLEFFYLIFKLVFEINIFGNENGCGLRRTPARFLFLVSVYFFDTSDFSLGFCNQYFLK